MKKHIFKPPINTTPLSEFVQASTGNQLTFMDNADPVGDLFGDGQGMSGHKDCNALPA